MHFSVFILARCEGESSRDLRVIWIDKGNDGAVLAFSWECMVV